MKKFYDLALEMQEANIGYINLVENGVFFQALGRDAVKLRHVVNLKPVCFKKNVCKCVIPRASIQKYVKILMDAKYAFTLNTYEKDKNEIRQLTKVEGTPTENFKECEYCPNCWYTKGKHNTTYGEIVEEIEKYKKQIENGNKEEE